MAPIGSRFPPARRSWPFWVASAATHLLLVVVWRLHVAATLSLPTPIPALNLALLEPFPAPPVRPKPTPKQAKSPIVTRPAPTFTAPAAPPAASAAEPPASGDPAPAPPPAAITFHRDLGDQRLRVRPFDPQQLAAIHRLTRTTAELADSVSRAVVQAYLDSMAIESARAPGPPSWTGTIAGAKFGLDSRYVYVAGLRIPTVLLALLPIPAGGNQSHAFDRSDLLLDDLRRAAARSSTLDEFKAAVRELRAQSELEHRLNEGQRATEPEEAPGRGGAP